MKPGDLVQIENRSWGEPPLIGILLEKYSGPGFSDIDYVLELLMPNGRKLTYNVFLDEKNPPRVINEGR